MLFPHVLHNHIHNLLSLYFFLPKNFNITPINTIKFSPFEDGIFATCSYDGQIKIWNMNTNKVLKT